MRYPSGAVSVSVVASPETSILPLSPAVQTLSVASTLYGELAIAAGTTNSATTNRIRTSATFDFIPTSLPVDGVSASLEEAGGCLPPLSGCGSPNGWSERSEAAAFDQIEPLEAGTLTRGNPVFEVGIQ